MVEVKVEPGTELPVEVQLLVEGVDTLTEADIISYILGAGIHPDNFEVTSAEISHNDDQIVEKTEEEIPEVRSTFLSKLKRLLSNAAVRNRDRGYTDLEGLVFLCPKEKQLHSGKRKPSYKYKKLFLKHYQLGQKFKKHQEINKQAVDELKRKIQVLKDRQRTQVEMEIKRTFSSIFTENQSKYLIHGDRNISWKKEDFIHSLALKSLAPQSYYYIKKMMRFPLPDDAITNHWLSKQDLEKKTQLIDSCSRALKKFSNRFIKDPGMGLIPELRNFSLGDVTAALSKIVMGDVKLEKTAETGSSANKKSESLPVNASEKTTNRRVSKKKPTPPQPVENDSSSEIEGMDVIRIDETFTIDDDDDPEWFPPPIERKRKPEEDTTCIPASTSKSYINRTEPPVKKTKIDETVVESDEVIANIKRNLENIFNSDTQPEEEVKSKTKPPEVKPSSSGNNLSDALKVLEMLSEHIEPSCPESPNTDVRTKRIVKPTQRMLESNCLSGKLFSTDSSGTKVLRQFARKSIRPSLDSLSPMKSPNKSKGTKVADVKSSVSKTDKSNILKSTKNDLSKVAYEIDALDLDSRAQDKDKKDAGEDNTRFKVQAEPLKKSEDSIMNIEADISELLGEPQEDMSKSESPLTTNSKDDSTPSSSNVTVDPKPIEPSTPKPNDSVKQVLLMRTRRSARRINSEKSMPFKKNLCPKSQFMSNFSMIKTLKN